MNISTILLLLLIGLFSGVVSGFVGIGGGVVIVPALVFVMGMSQHTAQGTTLAMMIPPIGILAVLSYYKRGMVNFPYAFILAASFVIGGYFGSKLAISVSEEVAKKVFGFVLLIIAIKIIIGK